jgi:hypothetical protein
MTGVRDSIRPLRQLRERRVQPADLRGAGRARLSTQMSVGNVGPSSVWGHSRRFGLTTATSGLQ